MLYNKIKGYFLPRWVEYNKERVAYASVDIQSFTINVDTLADSSSDFECFQKVPNAVKVGDIFIVLNSDGTELYKGVVQGIEETKVSTLYIYELLNYNVAIKKNTLLQGNLNQKLKQLINLAKNQTSYTNYAQTNRYKDDYAWQYLIHFWNNYYYTGEEVSYEQSFDDNTVVNIKEELYKISSLGFNFEINFPFSNSSVTPNTEIYCNKNVATKKQIEDINKTVFESSVLITEADNNVVQVYSSNDGRDLGHAYLTSSGLTTNPDVANRQLNFKNKIVFTDSLNFDEVIHNEMEARLYNHKIELNMWYDAKYCNFESYKLGDIMKCYVKGKMYTTVYTGYAMEYKDGEGLQKVKMIFGKVRPRLTQRKRWK